jgi:hypothetical protein
VIGTYAACADAAERQSVLREMAHPIVDGGAPRCGTAFRKRSGAEEFLQIVISGERALLEALFAGDDRVTTACSSGFVRAN